MNFALVYPENFVNISTSWLCFLFGMQSLSRPNIYSLVHALRPNPPSALGAGVICLKAFESDNHFFLHCDDVESLDMVI